MDALYRFLSSIGLSLGASCMVIALLGWIYFTFQVKRDLATFGYVEWNLTMKMLLVSMIAASILTFVVVIAE